MPPGSPTIVPSSVSSGCSGSAGGGGGRTGKGSGAAATTGGGGRREGANSGRSRVIGNPLSGIAHNGFPVGRDSRAARPLLAAVAGPEAFSGTVAKLGVAAGGEMAVKVTDMAAARTLRQGCPHRIAIGAPAALAIDQPSIHKSGGSSNHSTSPSDQPPD